VALLKRRLGAHLSDAVRETLAGRRPYPSLAAIRNPLTRPMARRIAGGDWRSTFEQIDFPYSLHDQTIADVPCVAVRPGAVRAAAPLIIYVHAGAFVAGSVRENATAVLPTCHLIGCEAIGIDYSLAPEAVYPQQLMEIDRVYRHLLASGRKPGRIVLLGDSAGGALALAAAYRWRGLGLPLPAGLALLSPILDADASSDTHQTVRGRDPLFASNGQESCAECFRLYAGGADVSNPEVSPLNGDPAGLPPVLIHVGTREILLGDSARLSEKVRRAGGDVTLRVFDGMFHLFHQHWRLAEAKAAHQDIADFVARVAG